MPGLVPAMTRRVECLRTRAVIVRIQLSNSERACVRILTASSARALRDFRPRQKQRAQGKPGARCTRGLVCNKCEETHTSIQVQSEHSGIPCAMALRLMARSPRRRIRLASVVGGLAAGRTRSDRLRLRSTWHQQRVSGPHGFAVRNERRSSCAPLSAHGRPALRIRFAPDAAASTASHPNVRDDRDTPLVERMRRGNYGADLGEAGSGLFFAMRLDGWNRVDLVREISVCAQRHRGSKALPDPSSLLRTELSLARQPAQAMRQAVDCRTWNLLPVALA